MRYRRLDAAAETVRGKGIERFGYFIHEIPKLMALGASDHWRGVDIY
jgi:hypothetical protein